MKSFISLIEVFPLIISVNNLPFVQCTHLDFQTEAAAERPTFYVCQALWSHQLRQDNSLRTLWHFGLENVSSCWDMFLRMYCGSQSKKFVVICHIMCDFLSNPPNKEKNKQSLGLHQRRQWCQNVTPES